MEIGQILSLAEAVIDESGPCLRTRAVNFSVGSVGEKERSTTTLKRRRSLSGNNGITG